MIHENLVHSSSPVQYRAGLFVQKQQHILIIVMNTENMKEICMAKLITYLTEYWNSDIHLPLEYWPRLNGNTDYCKYDSHPPPQYSTRLNGKYNYMLQNTGYIIVILHHSTQQD
jgi:hypothetical protein